MAPQPLTLSPIRSRPASPFATAPSSPKLLGYFSDDDDDCDFELLDSVSSFVPFNWEEKPGKPKTFRAGNDDVDDIAFEFRVDRLENSLSLPAEDLFAGGVIKPLKPPPRLLQLDSSAPISGRKSLSPSSAQIIVDPFEAAIESARNADEIETDETASFAGPGKFNRLRNLLLFRRFNDGPNPNPKANNNNGGFWSSGSGSGSGSSSTSGSGNEPDIGYEVGGRSLPLCRPHFFRCFMYSI